jgi:hypothetical protein
MDDAAFAFQSIHPDTKVWTAVVFPGIESFQQRRAMLKRTFFFQSKETHSRSSDKIKLAMQAAARKGTFLSFRCSFSTLSRARIVLFIVERRREVHTGT